MIVRARYLLRHSLLSGVCAVVLVSAPVSQAAAQDLLDSAVSDSALSGAVGEDSEGSVGAEPVPTESEVNAYTLAGEAMRTEDAQAAEALLRRALSLVPSPGLARGRISCLLAARLYQEDAGTTKVRPQTVAAADECNRQMPDDPNARMMAGILKLRSGQVRGGALLLIAALKAKPQIFAGWETSGMAGVFRQLGYSKEKALLAELRTALVQAGYGKDDPTFFSKMALDTMIDSIERNANSEAVALLPQVLDPEYGLRMLIDRRFEPIWPIVEEWARDNLQPQRDAKLATARSQFSVDPSLGQRQALASALWGAGKRAEAITLVKQAIDDKALWDKDRYGITSLTVRYAQMLLWENRADEGLAVAMRMNVANPGDTYPAGRNLMPNIASLLIRLGRHQDALDLIEREMPPPGSLEDPAAFGFYAALRFCAYHRMGRADDAARQAALLGKSYANNEPANRLRQSCAMDIPTMRAVWAQRMTEPETRGETLVHWYRLRQGFGQEMADDLTLDTAVQSERAALDAVFAGFARELPLSYHPALRMWKDDMRTAGERETP